MKYEFGDCTRRLSLCERFSDSGSGLRRSTARVCSVRVSGDRAWRRAGKCTDHRERGLIELATGFAL
jgi:hypothetical protein